MFFPSNVFIIYYLNHHPLIMIIFLLLTITNQTHNCGGPIYKNSTLFLSIVKGGSLVLNYKSHTEIVETTEADVRDRLCVSVGAGN